MRDFTVPTGIATRSAISVHDRPSKYASSSDAALIGAELGERARGPARDPGSRPRASSTSSVEPAVAGIARHASGLLQVEGSRAHTDRQPGTNPTALRIEVFRAPPGLEEHVVQEIFGLAPLAHDPHRQAQEQTSVALVQRGQRAAIARRHRRDERRVLGVVGRRRRSAMRDAS